MYTRGWLRWIFVVVIAIVAGKAAQWACLTFLNPDDFDNAEQFASRVGMASGLATAMTLAAPSAWRALAFTLGVWSRPHAPTSNGPDENRR